MSRVVVIVMDSAGVGALPDAAEFHDPPGANTIGNTAERLGGLHLPQLERLGLGLLTPVRGVARASAPLAAAGRLSERSRGKDTITGHWEMAGIVTEVPFPTYPDGFPPEVIEAFARIAGSAPLGNVAASGTEIIEELGPEHQRTGRPILYTSADSVFQIAAHEDTVPLERLYEWCERAREMLAPPHNVNRVIARPFTGAPGAYVRTANRRDYSLEPPPSYLDRLKESGIPVVGIGKIGDIYCGHGIAREIRVADNAEGMLRTNEVLDGLEHGCAFVNLNDFDSKYGHRRDVRGYGAALERLDAMLPALLERLRPGDGLIVTADHGCDPTAAGTDHTREYVPYLEFAPGSAGSDDGVIEGFAHVGRRMAARLGVSV